MLEKRRYTWLLIAVIVGLAITCYMLTEYLNILRNHTHITAENFHDENGCSIQIVESIPDGLNFTPSAPEFMSTYNAWKTLLNIANYSVNIGSFYWTLRGSDVFNHSSAAKGEDIFNQILSNKNEKNLNIRIVQSMPTPNYPDLDTEIFQKYGAADVRTMDFGRLFGSGVLHTKLWIVDSKHFYLGSANMDWRSLTQVKELGVLALNCSSLATDVEKIFNAYWYLGVNTSVIPKPWPQEYSTNINWDNPFIVKINESLEMSAFFSNSPLPLSASGRSDDLETIVKIIATADVFVNIAVMDYLPLIMYTEKIRYWPYLDDAIRAAAVDRKVSVKMLISWWPHSNHAESFFLRSLSSISSSLHGVDIEIKYFIIPSNEDQSQIPFSRVNHNKYMVTDNTAYIGTSNWSGDYFTDTAGIGLVLRETANASNDTKTLRTELLSIFKRDWDSPYAKVFEDI